MLFVVADCWLMVLCVAVRRCVFLVGSFLFDVCCFLVCLLLSIGVDCFGVVFGCRLLFVLFVLFVLFLFVVVCCLLFVVWC